jgi:hypothetical protein
VSGATRSAIAAALLLSLGACAGQIAATPGTTPMPIPTGPAATAPVPAPPEITLGLPTELPELAPASLVSAGASMAPGLEPDLNYVSDGWPHGQASSICGVTDLAISTSMWTWPGFVGYTTSTGGGKTYLSEFVMYRGWIGWYDERDKQNHFREGPWLGAFGSLAGLSDRTWVQLNGVWRQTGAITNDVAPYYGNDSKVPRPADGSFWTWIQYHWWPIYEGTPEHPGAMVFAGADHLDYVGISYATC